MVSAEAIRQLVEGNPELSKFFIVDVKVSKDNSIVVKADTDNGITIDECGELSAAIEASLDRDAEDFDLEVSSPGLSEPLKLPRQYLKNIGREVFVETIDGEKLRRVEGAEEALRKMGYTDLRVRLWHGAAKLQLPGAQLERAASERKAIREALQPWFTTVLLDLEER